MIHQYLFHPVPSAKDPPESMVISGNMRVGPWGLLNVHGIWTQQWSTATSASCIFDVLRNGIVHQLSRLSAEHPPRIGYAYQKMGRCDFLPSLLLSKRWEHLFNWTCICYWSTTIIDLIWCYTNVTRTCLHWRALPGDPGWSARQFIATWGFP